jgi:hypothetical protein
VSVQQYVSVGAVVRYVTSVAWRPLPMLTVENTADGPVAEGFLTYGNPDDPAAPAYRLGLEAWSAGESRPFLYRPDDVASVSAMEIIELSVTRLG